MTDLQQTYYRQVKNPNPVFTPREGAGTLKFCEKLMEKAVGFTSRFDFAIHVAHARSKGLRRRMPPVLRRRATRALTFLAELGLITYQTEYDPLIGCYIPTDITFTPALFAALDVSEDAVVAARRSRVEWENRQRKKQGLDTLGMDELIAKAWRFVRERFRSYQTELKSRGIKRARARRDANRERQDIVTLVKRQLTREISEGRFTANREAVKREVERRVKERMILSRNRNYSRLATASP
ncbi:TPA: incFII family plasmid replication initiator RepA [Escherichia coli]|nr:incFII family plasmid replication initiator RepA [Escherichia coli]HCL9931258.1 incFII family plasmid replication initiator RepA [Escherichia coli]